MAMAILGGREPPPGGGGGGDAPPAGVAVLGRPRATSILPPRDAHGGKARGLKSATALIRRRGAAAG